ncbi:MAG: restriction endonuclease subunit S [Elusimicrobiota bacterium]
MDKNINKIPKDWEVAKLGQYINVFSGYPFKTDDFLSTKEEGISIVKIGNLQDGVVRIYEDTNKVIEGLYTKLPEFQLLSGDVLIALSGATTGKIAVVEKDLGKALVNQRVGKFDILDDKKIKQTYFYYYSQTKTFTLDILKYIGQSAQGNLSPEQIKKIDILLPPLPEQQKIAEVFSTVDEAIQIVDRVIEKIQWVKKGLMNELLVNEPIGETKEEIVNIFSLEYGKGLTQNERNDGKYPVLGSNGIVGSNSTFLVKGPGIVIGRKGTIGAVKWLDVNFWPIDTAYFVVPKKDDLNLKWLYYKLVVLNLKKLNTATGIPGLNREMVYGQEIYVPSLPEQQKIAEILSAVDNKIEQQKKRKEKLEKVKRGLMDDLLTGKRRVKIN